MGRLTPQGKTNADPVVQTKILLVRTWSTLHDRSFWHSDAGCYISCSRLEGSPDSRFFIVSLSFRPSAFFHTKQAQSFLCHSLSLSSFIFVVYVHTRRFEALILEQLEL